MRMRSLRFWIGVAVALAAVVGVTILAGNSDHPARGPRSARAPVEPLAYLALSATGGVVREALVHSGDRVESGQVLVRFDAGQWEAQKRDLTAARNALASALKQRDTLFNISLQARDSIQDSHPDVVHAEEEYVEALAAFENSSGNRSAAKLRLDAAADNRVLVRREIARMLSSGPGDLRKLLAGVNNRIGDVDAILNQMEVRAASPGWVDILEVRVGDRILPGHAVASLIGAGEYISEIAVSDSDADRIGGVKHLTGVFTRDRRAFDWRVETISRRTIPLILRESRQQSEEIVIRARISLPVPAPPNLGKGAIPSGTLADFQLP